MNGMEWWDTNHDGHLGAAERDRYEYDNGLLPGQPDGYWYDYDADDFDDGGGRSYKKKSGDSSYATDDWDDDDNEYDNEWEDDEDFLSDDFHPIDDDED